jgi:hypothetical protein
MTGVERGRERWRGCYVSTLYLVSSGKQEMEGWMGSIGSTLQSHQG